MESRSIYPHLCKESGCLAVADFEFTDAKMEVKVIDERGASATSVETIVIGHACELHFEEVKQMLKEIHGDEEEA